MPEVITVDNIASDMTVGHLSSDKTAGWFSNWFIKQGFFNAPICKWSFNGINMTVTQTMNDGRKRIWKLDGRRNRLGEWYGRWPD